MNQQDKDRLRELAESANMLDCGVDPKYILSLLAENEELASENTLMRQHAAKQISDATLLTGIATRNGSMNVGLQGGAAQLLAESFFDQFQQSEAVNYLELRFESEMKMPGRAMVVTLQLVGGITPGQRIADQTKQITELAKKAARYDWVRQAGAWDSEIGLNSMTPEQYDAGVDAGIAAERKEFPHAR